MRLARVEPLGFSVFPIRDRATRLRAETFWAPERPEWAGWDVMVEGPVVVFLKGERRVEIPRNSVILEYGPEAPAEPPAPPPVVEIDSSDDEEDEADEAPPAPAKKRGKK